MRKKRDLFFSSLPVSQVQYSVYSEHPLGDFPSSSALSSEKCTPNYAPNMQNIVLKNKKVIIKMTFFANPYKSQGLIILLSFLRKRCQLSKERLNKQV